MHHDQRPDNAVSERNNGPIITFLVRRGGWTKDILHAQAIAHLLNV